MNEEEEQEEQNMENTTIDTTLLHVRTVADNNNPLSATRNTAASFAAAVSTILDAAELDSENELKEQIVLAMCWKLHSN